MLLGWSTILYGAVLSAIAALLLIAAVIRPRQLSVIVTDDRGITWLDAEVIARYADAVSSRERHILALVEALALAKPLEDVGGLMASLDPYHLRLVLAVAACRLWQRLEA